MDNNGQGNEMEYGQTCSREQISFYLILYHIFSLSCWLLVDVKEWRRTIEITHANLTLNALTLWRKLFSPFSLWRSFINVLVHFIRLDDEYDMVTSIISFFLALSPSHPQIAFFHNNNSKKIGPLIFQSKLQKLIHHNCFFVFSGSKFVSHEVHLDLQKSSVQSFLYIFPCFGVVVRGE